MADIDLDRNLSVADLEWRT